MNMIFASLRGNGLTENAIFNRMSSANRDDCFEPYIQLKEAFSKRSVQLDTADKVPFPRGAFEIHQDVQRDFNSSAQYLLLFETFYVKSENWEASEWARYRKIFTWDDELVDGDKFVKINFPNPMKICTVDGFSMRDRFCCLIAGNKTLATEDRRNLYPERVRAIRWFEKCAPDDFDLYGIDWDRLVLHHGFLGKLEGRMFKALGALIKLKFFPSYRGRVEHKREVLKRTRFAICYENIRDIPGYITEKIFDCFFSGCVPVYWGANNIDEYIPSDCYIDRRKFKDTADVYKFMKTITESEFIGYQERISDFLVSDGFYQFSGNYFAETVVNTILSDLEI